jgi:signal transduction histidine kinase
MRHGSEQESIVPVRWQDDVTLTMGRLSTSVVHDLRNPLGTVYAGAEILMDLDSAPPQVKRLAANIYRAAGRMQEILEDLACEVCGKKSAVETGDIREIIVGACQAAAAAAETQHVQIVLDVPIQISLQLMRTRIECLFFNLIVNAIEAMPGGGEVRIRARAADNDVLIEVQDTGPGIPKRIQDRLFERFVTADKESGLGLGLAVCRETVFDHGGDIWVEPAVGARFVIRLPLNREPPGRRGT